MWASNAMACVPRRDTQGEEERVYEDRENGAKLPWAKEHLEPRGSEEARKDPLLQPSEGA